VWGFFFVIGCLQAEGAETLAQVFLFIAGGYQAVRGISYLVGVTIFETRKAQPVDKASPLPKVSVLVPAYNEEAVIERTLSSLCKIQYPDLEILVIDDGSFDQTAEKAKAFVNHTHPIRVLTQLNAGKAEALNLGIRHANGELILCVDADSAIEANVLEAAVRQMMAKPECAAVAGVVDVEGDGGFAANFLRNQQRLEYYMGHLQKSTLALFGKTNVVPGPVGLFRKTAVEQVGGYRPASVSYAEDTDLTLRLIAAGYFVGFDPHFVTHTQVPADWDELLKQRYRWVRGTYQALMCSLPALIKSKRPGDRVFGLYMLSEQILTVAIEVGVLFYFVPRLVFYGDTSLFSKYFVFLLALDLVQALVSFRFKAPSYQTIFSVLGQRFYYSIVLLAWKVFALREEWDAITMSWNKVERYAGKQHA